MDTRKDSAQSTPTVTVIVIARNEEGNIRECLDSVIRTGEKLQVAETIFVDSRSTDTTVEIASAFPITVIRLGADQTPSPAAGRAVGTLLAHGRYIFYVDGDMILNDSWLPEAIRFMDSNPSFGAVFGLLTENMDRLRTTGSEMGQLGLDGRPFTISPTGRIAGSAVIRKSVIDQVGGFNPFLPGDEEAELSYRITSSGLKIGASNTVMAFHPRRKASTAGEILRRSKYGYFWGQGLVLRTAYRQGRKAFLHHLWRLKLYESYSAWIVMGLLTPVISVLTWSCESIVVWGGISLIGMTIQMIRHGPRDAMRRLLSSTLVGVGILRAFFRRVPEPQDFPRTFEQIK